ncbi:TPA: hypothetical protein HA241_01960 [Candidatus Woesearchaeota archaeon]|nr:hypothetical protein [Candidatus Woesearchaeota archaeon]
MPLRRNKEELNVLRKNEEEKLNYIYSNLIKTREAIVQHSLFHHSEPQHLNELVQQYTHEWKRTRHRLQQIQQEISAVDKTNRNNSILQVGVLGILIIIALFILSQVVLHVGKEKQFLSGAFSTEITNQSDVPNDSFITIISPPEQLIHNTSAPLNETLPENLSEVTASDQQSSANSPERELMSISSIGINDFSIQANDPVVLYLNATYDMADIYGRDSAFDYFLQFKWNISSIPADATINNATMCAFLFTTVGSLDSDTNITRVNDQTWDESSSASTINGQSLTNRTNNNLWSNVTTNLYGCLNVTNQIITDYNLANNFSTIRINDHDNIVDTISVVTDDASEFRWGEHNNEYRHRPREYTTQAQRPYLNVTYTLNAAADSVAPLVYLMTPANNTLNTTDNTPEFKFNATDETAATLDCSLYLNNSAGTVTNYGRNSSVINNTPTLITANDTLTNDNYYWWVNCSDGTNTNVSEQRNISISVTTPVNCGTLTSSTTMTQNLSSVGTCFTIGAASITLDCAGYKINYSTGGLRGYAINNSGGYDYVKIKNCLIAEGNISTNDKYGIFYNHSQNGTITNTTILTYGNYSHGIVLNWSSDGNNISSNTITTYGDTNAYGIYIINSTNDSIHLNTISTQGISANNYGIYAFLYARSNNISTNTIRTNGTSNNYGIFLSTTADNNTVTENVVNATGSQTDNYGIYLLEAEDNNLTLNTVVTFGTGDGFGIYGYSNVYHNLVFRNNIYTNNTGTNNYGIFFNTTATVNNISNNIVFTNGTKGNHGIFGATTFHNNTIYNNTVNTYGNNNSNEGIVITSAQDNNITWNTVTTNGTRDTYGISLKLSSHRNIILNNVIVVKGTQLLNFGVYITTGNSNNVSSNTITTTTGNSISEGIYILSSDNNSLYNNTITTNSSGGGNIGVEISSGDGNNVTFNTITTQGTSGNYGLTVDSGTGNSILNNTITTGTSSSLNYGVYLTSSVSSTNVSGNTITTNGTSSNYGIYLFSSTFNNSVNNNVIRTDGTSNGNYGIVVNNARENNVTSNTITTGGTASGAGIFVQQSNRNLLFSNTITPKAGGGSNEGIHVSTSCNENNLSNNVITTNGTNSNYGISLSGDVDNNTVANNIISTNGSTTLNYGIRISDGEDNNITSNTITTFGSGQDQGIVVSSDAYRNNILKNSITINSTGSSNYGIYLTGNVSGSNVSGNTIITNGSTENYGIYFTNGVENSTIYNNTIKTNGSSSTNYGIIVDTSQSNNISFNDITTTGTSSNYGVYLFKRTHNNRVFNNVIRTNGTAGSNDGIRLDTNISYNNVSNNIIRTNGTSLNNGITLILSSNNNTLINNSILTAGNSTNNTGIYINHNSTNNTFVENNITTSGTTQNFGVVLLNEVENNTFLNNNISANSDYEILDSTTDSFVNYLIYNNSFGELQWIDNGTEAYVRNLTINVTNHLGLGLGSNLFIDNNTVSVNLSAFSPLRINGSANLTLYDVGLSAVDNFIFLNRYSTNRNDTRQNGTLCATCTLFSFSSGTALFNATALGSFSANKLPAAPILLFPDLGNRTVNRTPLFSWNNSADEDLDPLSYNLVIDDNNDFTSPEVNVSGITNTSSINTTYGILTELAVDTVYFWKVQANDTSGYGTNSSVRNFTVDSFLAVNVLNGAVLFGSVTLDSEHSTDDNDPDPFLLENGGNIFFNISVTGTRYFTAVGFPSFYYQFKARENESGSFNTTLSAMNWLNMTNSSSTVHVALVDWHDVNDNAAIDLNVSVPDNESQGQKTSTITFTVTG